MSWLRERSSLREDAALPPRRRSPRWFLLAKAALLERRLPSVSTATASVSGAFSGEAEALLWASSGERVEAPLRREMEAAPASEFPPGVSACRALVLRLLRQGYTASSAAAALESGALFASPEKRSDLLGALASLLDDCLSSDETNSTKGAAHAASPEKEASSSSSSDAENFPPSKKRAREACVKDADGQCVSGEKASGSLILDDTLAAHSLATLLGVLEQVENPPPSLSHPSVARAAASSLRCFFSFLRGFRGGQAEEDAGGSPAVFADAADIQRALDLRVEALAKLFLKLKASSAGARSAGVGGQHLWVACGARLQRLREWTAILPRLAERRSELVQKLCASSNLASLPSLLGDPQDVRRVFSSPLQKKRFPFGSAPRLPKSSRVTDSLSLRPLCAGGGRAASGLRACST